MSAYPHARFLLSAASPAQFPADRGIEVAFAGRSNAGKSSAINAIAQRNALARTSKTPGRTRLLNFFELAPDLRIVDLPGYGYADVPEAERRKWAPLIDALLERESLRALFLIVDARRGLGDADAALIKWAQAAAREVRVLLAKADKLKRSEAIQVERAVRAGVGDAASVQLFSAVAGTGVEAARRALEELRNAPPK
ncbi:MAG: ribosome biogenesis GTP-binding protein YihA/YsxC [Gammaproteobacteria bacterium]